MVKRKNKRVILGIIAIILLIGAAAGGKYVMDLTYYENTMSKLEIGDIDPGEVKDGTYTGSYDARIIAATVSVTVRDGKITDIKLLEHKNGRGGPAEDIVDDILKEQSLDVDVVSGATNSSKAIMKAVENALESDPVLP
jgi:uncharacterized protein with FMN-binding domain